jgi:2-C-methyl-D-erythritol 4-phosphate cytidylyltransferase/2-C-methyl-D-erythritol 2,4-cyclodiphosphate synthase
VTGGRTRQDSSFKGVIALPEDCRYTLIHDAARPFVSPKLINKIIQALQQGYNAVIPVLPVTDTIKQIKNQEIMTLSRETLRAVQTPQGFCRQTILNAHQASRSRQTQGTDDSFLVEILREKIHLVSGELDNIKITNPNDLYMLKNNTNGQSNYRLKIGFGYDVHRYGSGNKMVLGGIPITNGPEIVAHSDGDVLIHALIDAFLGCLSLGDIGDHFPDNDPKYSKISSGILLAETMNLLQQNSMQLEHVDLTLICQVPKISTWKKQIKKNLIQLLNLNQKQLNIKATSEEGMGFTGEKKGIKAVAVVTAREFLPTY